MATAGNSTAKRRKRTAAPASTKVETDSASTPARTRKPAQPASTARKLVEKVAQIEEGALRSTGQKVKAIRSAASKAVDASQVPQVAKSLVTKSRKKAVSAPKRKSAARRTAPSAGAILGIAAAGVAAGIVANLGRKAAVQAPSLAAGDWFDALKLEHKAALGLLDKLAATTSSQPAKRSALLTQLKHALSKHAFTEENVIYPALREWGDKADADALNHEQGYHKQFLYDLDGMDKTSSEFARKVVDFREDLNSHIREEEDKIFPKLKEGLSLEKNEAITALANREGFKLA
jgi:hemerythrin superfamily protein